MIFEDFFDAWYFLLFSSFILSLILGFTAQKTGFCTMGALSDWFNFGNKDRLKAWVLAIGVSILGVGILEYQGIINASEAFPNYRSENFLYAENILGGILFGIGMTFAAGCGNKTLVRIGEGDLNSFFIMLVMSVCVYYSINIIPGTDETIYSYLFHDWIRPLSITLNSGQDLPSIIANITTIYDQDKHDLFLYSVLGSGAIYWGIKNNSKIEKIISGFVVGIVILSLWVLSNNIFVDIDDEKYKLHSFINEWDVVYEPSEESDEDIDIELLSPQNPNSFKSQSFTFVNPIGHTFALVKAKKDNLLNKDKPQKDAKLFLNIGIMAVLGVIIGSFISNVLFDRSRPKVNLSPKILLSNAFAGALMGIGGTLAIGCTIGQGITGMSTLSIGSALTLLAIVLGSFLAQKTMERYA